MCAPRVRAGEARLWGAQATERTERPLAATVGSRGGRSGQEGTSCQGLGLPSFAKEVLPGSAGRGQEVGRRLVQGRGRRTVRGRCLGGRG